MHDGLNELLRSADEALSAPAGSVEGTRIRSLARRRDLFHNALKGGCFACAMVLALLALPQAPKRNADAPNDGRKPGDGESKQPQAVVAVNPKSPVSDSRAVARLKWELRQLESHAEIARETAQRFELASLQSNLATLESEESQAISLEQLQDRAAMFLVRQGDRLAFDGTDLTGASRLWESAARITNEPWSVVAQRRLAGMKARRIP